jgi:hypothetical protein
MLSGGTAFGLSFTAPAVWPDWTPCAVKTGAVAVVWGSTPTTLPPPCQRRGLYQGKTGEFLLTVPKVARYHITPNQITITPEAQATESAIRVYLFGSAMGALLHLRGILAFHSSAVRLPDGRAVLLAGASTAGKSTLAAALCHRGYPLLADDLAAVHWDAEGQAWVYPGLARCKLWADALEKLALVGAEKEPLAPTLEKYQLTLAINPQPAKLAYLYEIHADEQATAVAMTSVTGLAKLQTLDKQTYRPGFITALEMQAAHLQRLAQVTPQVQVRRLIRPRRAVNTLDALVALLQRDWADAG